MEQVDCGLALARTLIRFAELMHCNVTTHFLLFV